MPAKKLSRKEQKAAQEAEKAAQTAKAAWLTQEKAELKRLSDPPRRARGGDPAPPPSADVRLAAYRPVQVLMDAAAR
jgi:hypothetical protein